MYVLPTCIWAQICGTLQCRHGTRPGSHYCTVSGRGPASFITATAAAGHALPFTSTSPISGQRASTLLNAALCPSNQL